ncbi:MAG: thiol:disulfide interchange protein DsbA/DsbL [Methylophaga sp.]|nr:thiol:disulfide interchange protein DsbA/DsbL [Methylophaga sp.]
MKKMITAALLLGAALLPINTMAMPEAFIAGVHYKSTAQLLATSSEDKVEVIEMFSYACPHCYDLDPLVEEWKKTIPENVVFVAVPAIFRDSWLELAKLFYTAEATGDLEKLHPLIFKAIHVEKRRMVTEEDMLNFAADQGIDRESFEKMMNSFAVKGKVKKALIMSQLSGITGVPSMIVNGKYISDAPMAGGQPNLLKAVDFLILKESE